MQLFGWRILAHRPMTLRLKAPQLKALQPPALLRRRRPDEFFDGLLDGLVPKGEAVSE